jgi:hypothetical protein
MEQVSSSWYGPDDGYQAKTGRPVTKSLLNLPPRPVWLLQAPLLIPNTASRPQPLHQYRGLDVTQTSPVFEPRPGSLGTTSSLPGNSTPVTASLRNAICPDMPGSVSGDGEASGSSEPQSALGLYKDPVVCGLKMVRACGRSSCRACLCWAVCRTCCLTAAVLAIACYRRQQRWPHSSVPQQYSVCGMPEMS